ncbi:MAG: hypothetical protein ABI821_05215 [Pseudomonadota bacterium]
MIATNNSCARERESPSIFEVLREEAYARADAAIHRGDFNELLRVSGESPGGI